ncbi:hypothetical protein L3476_13720 [Paenibacillus thiaminolyticus]|uniref:hypothetical protein n=1 Tax=Paenibacillus thiaminolyticus TaxID=49283 RepID=UPI0023505992|nr:hypothetical protein [Paenibacillus thiaminolyticus]WCR29680.1 hypothetical protein L3476_13720 [Paenibacillus thiaminolyticus]
MNNYARRLDRLSQKIGERMRETALEQLFSEDHGRNIGSIPADCVFFKNPLVFGGL